MATPLSVSIPPLREGQRISEWEPKFRASVISIEERAAVRLLPAYVTRGKLEESVVLVAIQKDTLDEAFKILKERLNPTLDVFEAANTFRQLIWSVGELVHDFTARYLEEGLKAGLNAKQVCTFMTTQLPVEVRQAAKEWVKAKEEEFGEADGISFAVKARELLLGKGLALNQGYRDRGPERVSQVRLTDESSRAENEESSFGDTDFPPQSDKVQVIKKRSRYRTSNYSQGPRGGEYYICHKQGHGYRMCPDRPCGICGRLGHKPFLCPNGYSSHRGVMSGKESAILYSKSGRERMQ